MEKFHNSPPVDPVVSITAPEIKKRLGFWVRTSISVLVIGGMATAFAADEVPAGNESEEQLESAATQLAPDDVGSPDEQAVELNPQFTPKTSNLTVLFVNTLGNGNSLFIQGVKGLANISKFVSMSGSSKTPSVDDLLKYDVVMLASNSYFKDPVSLGDNLAVYVDKGGKVILYEGTWLNGGKWKLAGKIMTPEYSPLAGVTYSCCSTWAKSESFENHPITEDVNSISTKLFAYSTAVQGNAKPLGNYDKGYLLGAYNPDKPIVAINVFPLNNYWRGDLIRMTGNALDWVSTNSKGGPGKFEFSSKIYFANENAKNAIVKVARKGGSTGVVSVNYATAAFEDRDTVDPTNNPASEGEDYATTEGSLTWKDGETGIQTFKVPVFDDQDEEGDETVKLVLSSPTGAALGDKDKISAKLRIADDECHGVYTTEARTLYHPLITVPVFDPVSGQPTEDVQVFEGTFTLLHGTEDFKIDVTDQEQFNFVKQIKNVDKLKADCYAKYDWQTETFQIPYVDVPSIVVLPMGESRVGPTQIFRAKMQQMPLSGEYGIGNYLFHVEGAPFQDASITADPNASVKTESKDEPETKVDASIEIAPDELTYYQYLYTYDK